MSFLNNGIIWWSLIVCNIIAYSAVLCMFIVNRKKEEKRIKKLNKHVDDILQSRQSPISDDVPFYTSEMHNVFPFRNEIIDELSRYVLVYDRETNTWVKRRQID
jgi:Mg2+/citrate symporter